MSSSRLDSSVSIKHVIYKWTRREFWPWWLFYIPVYVYRLFLAIRARNIVYFTAANPGIQHGGFVGYSKRDILQKFDQSSIPKTKYLDIVSSDASNKKDLLTTIKERMDSEGLQFPIIIKPDQGRRGQGVRKIQSLQEATEYVVQLGQPCLLQEFSEYKEEFAVVYYRYPDAKMGYVGGVTQKSFFDIVGDGVKTVEELVAEHPRGPLYKNVLYEANTKNRQKVLGQGEVFRLMPVGSHSRGTIFEDISHKISPELDATIDSLAKQIPDAYFGRFDIKAENFEALEKGYVHIMEFNGTEAEPVHMYDPQNSLFDAYAIMFAHRYRMYTIAIKNNENGFAYASRKEIYANVRKIM